MPITFSCSCGQQLQVDDEYAGAQAQCPECNAVLAVPAPFAPPVAQRPSIARPVKRREPVETDDDLAAEADSLNPYESRRRAKRRRDEDGDPRDEEERPSKKARRLADEDDEERPRKRRKRKEPPKYNAFNNQTVGGVICLVLSAAVFGIGLYFNVICVRWVLVLCIGGIIAIVRGLITGQNE